MSDDFDPAAFVAMLRNFESPITLQEQLQELREIVSEMKQISTRATIDQAAAETGLSFSSPPNGRSAAAGKKR